MEHELKLFEVVGIIDNEYRNKVKVVYEKFDELRCDAVASEKICYNAHWKLHKDAYIFGYRYAYHSGNFKAIVSMCDMAKTRLTHLSDVDVTTVRAFESLYLSLYEEFTEALDDVLRPIFDHRSDAFKSVFCKTDSDVSWHQKIKTKVMRRFCSRDFHHKDIKIWDGDLI